MAPLRHARVQIQALTLISLIAVASAAINGVAPGDSGVFEFSSGVLKLGLSSEHVIRLFGTDITDGARLSFTPTDCATDSVLGTSISGVNGDNTAGEVSVTFTGEYADRDLYLCLDGVDQGTAPGVTVRPFDDSSSDFLPVPVMIVFIIVLLMLSGCFSGLNLGLMALDVRELQIFVDAGDEEEKKNAKTILPLRRRGNLLLCTILLGNVLVNSTLTILLDGLAGGLAAVLGSTAGIVVFGEIVPQAICSRHGLWIGAHTIWLTRFFVLITLPISYPISVILDYVLGEEVGNVYQRRQLLQLIRLQSAETDLGRQEMEILQGALTYKEKTVEEVMTNIDDVFMLDATSTLDFKTMSRIMESGHSRIPVYASARENICGVLHVKDLAFIDPDDKTPLQTVIKYYNHQIEEVYNDTKLDKMLDFFRQGKTHICFVVKIITGDGDPYREVVGIVTLEDVIEEIIQAEIIDETDRIVDNRTKSMIPRQLKSLRLPADIQAESECVLSEQMMLAAFTYLSTSVEPFSETMISENVLRRLLGMRGCSKRIVLTEIENESEKFIYRAGHVSNRFVLVLEGKLRMRVGKDSLAFDAGPFTTLGVGALQDFSTPFIPDFTAVIVSEYVLLFELSRELYMEAMAASRRAGGTGGDAGRFGGSGPSGGAATGGSGGGGSALAATGHTGQDGGSASGGDTLSLRHERSLRRSMPDGDDDEFAETRISIPEEEEEEAESPPPGFVSNVDRRVRNQSEV